MAAKLSFLGKEGQPEAEPLFADYRSVKRGYDRAAAAAGLGIEKLLTGSRRTRDFLEEQGLQSHCLERFRELAAYHERQDRCLTKDIALAEVLTEYRRFVVMDTCLMPAPRDAPDSRETLSFSNGHWAVSAQMRGMVSLMVSARQRLAGRPGLEDIESELSIPRLAKLHHNDVYRYTRPLPNRSANMWTQFGYLMFKMLSFGRSESYLHFSDPVDLPYMHDVESLRRSLAVLGETVLSLAHGNGTFAPIQVGWLKKQFGGRVLASGIGRSMAPRYPLKGAVMSSRPYFGHEYSWPGFYDHLLIMTDPYGRYEIVNCSTDFWVDHYIWAKGYSPVAAWHGPDGVIRWMKDEGEEGQRLYKSVNLNWFEGDVSDVTLVAFRAAPVAFLDMTNPQTMRDYAGVRMLERDGLSPFRKQCSFDCFGTCVHYIEPDKYLYAALEAGTADNELAKVIRGFLIGPVPSGDSTSSAVLDREIDGEGYLAAETPRIGGMPWKLAESMTHLNGETARHSKRPSHGRRAGERLPAEERGAARGEPGTGSHGP